MKTKKAFIAKNRVYPSKDAAILCTGSKDVTVVNIRADYEFEKIEFFIDYEDEILLIDFVYNIDPDLITWHEAIEFQYVNGEFQQMFNEVELSIKDLSQELQDEIAELVKESICSTCDGEGYIDTIECGKSASYCCGGCVETIKCPDCNK